MLRHYVLLLILLLVTSTVKADFTTDFNRSFKELEAEKLFQKKEFVQAGEAFDALAVSSRTDEHKAKWLARSAVALGMQQDKYEQGLELAAKVQLRPYAVLAQMELMITRREYKALIGTFGEENIADWPVYETTRKLRAKAQDARVYGWYMRAQAYNQLGQGESAHKDVTAALAMVSDPRLEASMWLFAASNLKDQLSDDRAAYEAYRRLVALEAHVNGSVFYQGVIHVADYLCTQGQYDEAIVVLNKMKPQQQRGYWFGQSMLVLARIQIGKGQKEEGMATYQKLLDEKGIQLANRSIASLELGSLLVKAGQKTKAIEIYRELVANDQAPANDRATAQNALDELLPGKNADI